LALVAPGLLAQREFTKDFDWTASDLRSRGVNPFFNLEPGYSLTLEDAHTRLVITVLDETRRVMDVETRVIEERETKDGKLIEVSRNFFAISARTNSVYYFGEDVDMYKDGKVTNHEGAWLAGVKDAKPGMMMPGDPLVGARYYQEVAPGVAMDRAEVVSLTGTLTTPAGKFTNVLRTTETTPLEPVAKEDKLYARGVGLIQDGDLRLVKYGK
jgi:hypothetical protein